MRYGTENDVNVKKVTVDTLMENVNIAPKDLLAVVINVIALRDTDGSIVYGIVLLTVDTTRYGTENDVNVKKVTVDTLMENVNIAPKDLLAVVINVIALRDTDGSIVYGIVLLTVDTTRYGTENDVNVKKVTVDTLMENVNIAPKDLLAVVINVIALRDTDGSIVYGIVLLTVDTTRYGTENDVNVKKVTVDTLMENVNIAPKDLLAVVINVIALRDINGLIASGIVENIVESIKYGMENNVFVKRDTEDIKITASLALYTQIVLMENVFAKMDINGLKANGNVINTVEKMKNGMENIVFVSMDILI